jgi:hypothetical protein
MSIQAVAWALEQDIPARPKLVLVSLANHADHTNGYCWLKAETIGAEAACSPRAVFNFVGDLIRNGYVRKSGKKGADGKQRANDFWLLFEREQREWISDRSSASDEAEPQDVVEPDAPGACGETSVPTADQCEEIPAGAVGPLAPACQPSDEPSKTNPKESSLRTAHVPRGYRAPPPEPQGAVLEHPTKPIFVYVGTPAWDAWCAEKLRTTGRKWTLSSTANIDGKRCTGWYFPTLYPPSSKTGKESGDDDDPDLAKLQESRMHR